MFRDYSGQAIEQRLMEFIEKVVEQVFEDFPGQVFSKFPRQAAGQVFVEFPRKATGQVFVEQVVHQFEKVDKQALVENLEQVFEHEKGSKQYSFLDGEHQSRIEIQQVDLDRLEVPSQKFYNFQQKVVLQLQDMF